ncbi:hypothetical protein MSAN_00599600 [Mycena sanguinolenta]|uniref:DUF6532 domain-containing protein n=1 Tax=Mycena sanguinolenta TaxID=230812 RepID=A0A8H6ZAD0_9AGAR|nr:hypothetical protein MSAN_00599600 [Mycena sanguinolenta]
MSLRFHASSLPRFGRPNIPLQRANPFLASHFLSSPSQFLSTASKLVSHASQLFSATIALILARDRSHRLLLWTKQTAEFSHSTSAAAKNTKPATGDYADIPHALILRACAEYSTRILAHNPYLDVPTQIMSAKECFKSACRAAKERYVLTDRMGEIIRARGSQKYGKMVEIFHAICPSHFGFVRTTATKQSDANRLKTKALLEQAFFHYQDPASRTDSSGALFPSYFDPYPISALAFELATLEFVICEWSTGSFIQAKFTEKDVAKVEHPPKVESPSN